jgi:hypothetical protein
MFKKSAAPSSGYNITKSVRLRSSASASLTRTFGSPTSNIKWTLSTWVKRGAISTSGVIIGAGTPASGTYFIAEFATDSLDILQVTGGSVVARLTSTAVYRDPSAWYHLVFVWDSGNATAANRLLMYVNGSQVTSFSTQTNPSLNLACSFNTAASNAIGYRIYNSDIYFDGYLAEINFIDGQALTPSSFGSTNASTGVWQPVKYTGTYGNNGFYLKFTNTTSTTTLGYDSSGNSNNWTTNNISLTAGSTYDSMTDVPTLTSTGTANYCVMSPIDQTLCSVTNGNLYVATNNGGYGGACRGTFGVSSGKWYWETQIIANGGSAGQAPETGIMATATPIGTFTAYLIYGYNGNKQQYTNGSLVVNTAYGSSFTTGDIIGVALDMDGGTLTYYKNNVSQGTAFTGITGTYSPVITDPSTGGTVAVNFGQQGFAYTPPTGYKALNTYNLPTSTVVKGNTLMDATLYTGNSTAGTNIYNSSGTLYPDLVWVKSRSNSTQHNLANSVAGAQYYLVANGTAAETNDNRVFSALGSGYFQLGSDVGSAAGVNISGNTYVGWQWQAGAGSSSSNTDGSITSTVSVNKTAGFSVVSWTQGSSTSQTIGHGLGVAPAMFIVKDRTATSTWYVYHQSIGNTGGLHLNDSTSTTTTSNFWNNTSPTSSVMTISTNCLGSAGDALITYCWAAISGFSAFGSYTGNGSSSNPPFIYTGFRPRFIMTKCYSNTSNWTIFNTSINPYNTATLTIQPNSTAGQSTGEGTYNLLSNGFQPASVITNECNVNGYTYIYAAFAENPFKYALAR